MQIEKLHTPEEVIAECAVVIDVLRAFTTAAFAFSVGARKIIPVADPGEAFEVVNREASPFHLKNQYALEGSPFEEHGIPHHKIRKILP